MLDDEIREDLLRKFSKDRYLAHRHLFAHRRKEETPEFHDEILKLFYSDNPNVAVQAFRGGAKSTLIEEYILLEVLFRTCEFAIITGNSYDMAKERLTSIKQELDTNDALIELFGDQHGSVWQEGEIVLANGIKIQALGARQSMRGVKHNNERPDLAVIDDLEDEEMVNTPEAIEKTSSWLYGTLAPALNPITGKKRMLGTPLHPKAVIEQVMTDEDWVSARFPVCYIDEEGVERSSWPARFPMEFIEKLRRGYAQRGKSVEFQREYMCSSEDPKTKTFKSSMFKVEAAPAVWMPMQAMVDPARTTGPKSARTGYAVWSWVGSQLYVHEAEGHFHAPDQMINKMFELDEKFKLIELGVEIDGLEQFILQPLRVEQLKRRTILPIVPLKAPHDKNGFITGALQPFYNAGSVIHTGNFKDLTSELLQFPLGRKDVPNALAYAPTMRGGRPVYEEFNVRSVAQGLDPDRRSPLWLILNSKPAMTCATVVQMLDGAVRVFADYIQEAPPIDVLEGMVREIIMTYGQVKLVAPLEQFDRYNNNGVVGVCNKLKMRIDQAGSSQSAQGTLTKYLQKMVKGEVGFLVDETARWTLNGMARGYAREMTRAGMLSAQPKDNPYKLVIGGLESFCQWADNVFSNMNDDKDRNYRYTEGGQRYLSSLPSR